MSIDALKEQARRHEQREEWKKALELYRRAIAQLEKEEQPDVALYNRAGDLCVRLGDLPQATGQYEQAADLYLEAELPNNAIAVCKKIIRHLPSRNAVYLKMGRIRGQQGFLTDARQYFLTYAERIQAEGDMAEALRAIEELADLSPDAVDIRLSLAQQLQQHGRPEEALDQLRSAHATLVEAGDTDGARAVETTAREIDPTARLAHPPQDATVGAPEQVLSDDFGGSGFELRDVSSAEVAAPEGKERDERDDVEEEDALVLEGFEISTSAIEGREDTEEDTEPVEALPGLEGAWPSFYLEEEEAGEEAEPLPGLERDEPAGSAGPVPSFAADEEEEPAEPLPFLEIADEEEEGDPLPFLRLDDEEDEERGEPLPLLDTDEGEATPSAEDLGEADRDERIAGEVVTPSDAPPDVAIPPSDLDFSASGEEHEGAVSSTEEPPSHPAEPLIAAGDLDGAERMLRDLMSEEPAELSHRQRLVEVAFRRGDPQAQAEAYVELARCLERTGSEEHAGGVYQQVLQLDPENAAARDALAGKGAPGPPEATQVASSEDYVDLGSLIFGDDEEEEKTTRFQVAYEEPTGDEQADFARMLKQFKAKIAQNVGADDVRAHHDLGTAYKEMGLLDEAIEEFQAALRASREHLPTYELLGQCFLDKGQADAAVRSLERALSFPVEVEDELLGIYYYLGRAYESTGNEQSALEFYDRVFSLDINFMDVTERLRALR
jgi:tetratricopeptide (TPR) repeat protein